MIVPDIWASDTTHWSNFSGNQHAWPPYHTIGNIQKDICHTLKVRTWLNIRLIPYLGKGAKKFDKGWHNLVGTVLTQLMHLDTTGPGLKWDCPDGFRLQCYLLRATWVRNNQDQVMFAQVLYGLCTTSEIP